MKSNIRDIEYILAIAEEGSVTKASQKLYIAQPIAQPDLKKGGGRAGGDLVYPRKRAAEADPRGGILYKRGDRIMDIIHELDGCFSGLSNAASGKLVVGVPYLLGTLVATYIIPVYRKRFPRIDQFQLVESSSTELEQLLMEGSIDTASCPCLLSSTRSRIICFWGAGWSCSPPRPAR